MITIEETVSISKLRPEVFAYVVGFTTTAEWDPGMRSSRLVSGDGRGWIQVGAAGTRRSR